MNGSAGLARQFLRGMAATLLLSFALHPTLLVAQPPQRSQWSPTRDPQKLAQAQLPPVNQAPVAPGETIQLDIGPQIQLKALVETVIQRLQLNVIYDDRLLDRVVRLRVPKSIPTQSLLPLLRSVLKSNDLALQDADVSGWKRIVPTLGGEGSRLPSVAPIREPGQKTETILNGHAVTQVFLLQRADPTEVDLAIQPLLNGRSSFSMTLPDQNVVIVTDFASNLQNVERMIQLLDGDSAQSTIEFIRLSHSNADEIGTRLQDLLQAQSEGDGDEQSRGPKISIDTRTNQLIVVGGPAQIAEVRGLVGRLDVPSQAKTQVYTLTNTTAERMDELITDMLGDDVNAQFKSAVDADGNKLLITGSAAVQSRIATLISTVDVERSDAQSPVRFYKLKNVTALELVQTLRSLEGQSAAPGALGFGTPSGIRGVSGGTRNPAYRGSAPLSPGAPYVPGPNFPTFPGSNLPPPPGDTLFRGQESEPENSQIRLTPGQAKVTADESTNTVIVVAEPEEQRVYEQLIRALDQRRPQVLIEARLVLIDTSHDFSLGVEVSGGDRQGDKRLFAFTSYGLSNVDPVTGALSLIPGRGFNGTLVDPDVADVVVRALTRHRCARVLSAPRLVVYDNATGLLTSVNEEPFVSTNINNVASTTAFAGFAEAGTTIEVTPHISGEDYLRLDYTISVNTFTGPATETSPPPRKTDEIVSTVTIPDGHTVIVGGLNQQSARGERSGVPGIANIPLLRFIQGSQDDMNSSSALFVFLRPVILRDDKFRNLRALSEIDIRRARTRGDYPHSEPMLMKR